MSNWTLVDKTTVITPTVEAPSKARTLYIFRQSVNEATVATIPAAAITDDLRMQLKLAVQDAVDRSRRCLVTLTGGKDILGQIDTLVSKIDHDKSVTKTDLYPILYGHSFASLGSGKKNGFLTRFFGTKTNGIVSGIDASYDSVKKEYKTSITPSLIFRTVLGNTIIGLNLINQGIVLGDKAIGAYGDSITNWDAWKVAIPKPGLLGYDAEGIIEALNKGMSTMAEGHLRVNIKYLQAPAGTYSQLHYPGGVFRNSDMFTLTYLHEATHLFAATSDSYYFDKPWEDGGIAAGADNPHNELDNGKPTTERCLMNADSYAWLIYQLGDTRFSA
jgi:hypothetical protein